MAAPNQVDGKARSVELGDTHVPETAAERRAGERSSPGRSADAGSGTSAPDPEVPAKARRRAFSAQYKLQVLRQADACRDPGDIGALLRREGLYSSHLTSWRRQREQGALKGMAAQKRGPAAAPARDREVEQLRRENERLRKQLEKAEIIIDCQKKVSETLERLRAEAKTRENS